MGELKQRLKISLLQNGNGIFENYVNNSLYFYNLYKKSTDEFKNINIDKIVPGGFYFFHYKDESNWMKWAPVFFSNYKKLSNKIIFYCVNLNFIPLEARIILFDKFITEKDFENDDYLKVDYEGIYNVLREIGFEYALMEFDASRIDLIHKVKLEVLPRFLYHQHPKNVYDPNKLMQIWESKLKNRDKRHRELIISTIDMFFDVEHEISEKIDILKGHVERLRRNINKYG